MTRQRNPSFLFIGVVLASLLGWYIHTWAPTTLLVQSIFFSLFFLTIFSILLFIINHIRRAILISIGVTMFLLLRAWGLREAWYLFLMIASLVSVEWLFGKR